MDSQWEYTAEGSQGYSQPYSYPPPADALPLTGEADFEAQRAVHALLYPAQSQPTNADASNPRSTDQEALHAALLAQQAQQVTTYENILLHNSPPAQPVQVQHSSLSPYSTFDTVYTSDETATYGSNYQYYGAGGMPEYSTDSQPISADLTTSTPATTTRGGGWTSTPAEPKRIAPRAKFRKGARAWYRLDLNSSASFVVDVTGSVYNTALGYWEYDVSFNAGEYTWFSVPEANLSRLD